ncbi:MAG: GNAT family protein [Kofleriaceae bacterium]|nr:GNAT family protein [Kofleriaceae bacterium]
MTQRLVLRDFVEEDWLPLRAIEARPEVVRYMTQDVASDLSIRAYIASGMATAQVVPRMVFDLALTLEGQFIGRCGLKRKDHEPRVAEIWYLLHPAHHGNGYAFEAARALVRFGFQELGLHRIYADVDPRNVPSARLVERLGMRREAHFVKDVWIKGEWCDTVIYGMLDDEWVAKLA